MILKKYIFSALLSALTFSGLQAQNRVVTDNHGRKMEIYIPEAEEENNEVEYTDAKFYGRDSYQKPAEQQGREVETESDAIGRQIRRLSGSIPMLYNDEVKRHIDRYLTYGRRQTSRLLARARYYNHFFEEALRYYGLPAELKHLPVIESGLNPNAISPVGAVGLWQFMSATGRQYNLCINNYVDERRDPIKSSYAAARFLGDLYRDFGDWMLALAAYNCGPARVRSAIEKAGGVCDFWKIYDYLPKETRGYVPAFIAANYVMTHFGDYNLQPQPIGLPEMPGKVMITQDVSFAKLASVLNMSVEDLKILNPQYKQGIVKTMNGNATLVLPPEKVARFNAYASPLCRNKQQADNAQAEMAVCNFNVPMAGNADSRQRIAN
nr:lytic transglycosylase domain-containing protein [uncultured Prevotella sp.]